MVGPRQGLEEPSKWFEIVCKIISKTYVTLYMLDVMSTRWEVQHEELQKAMIMIMEQKNCKKTT